MKKISAIALFLAAVLALSACESGGKDQGESEGSNTSSTTTGSTPGEGSGDGEEENGGDSEGPSAPSEEVLAVIENEFDFDSFTGPDGKEVMLTEAASTNGYMLAFDFGYIRIADGIYSDTVANPDLYDFEDFAFSVDNEAAANTAAFKVVKGQKLDNGMTVVEARYDVMPDGRLSNSVVLDGEITVEGLLFCFFEEEYGFTEDEVIFYPNPASAQIPAIWLPDSKLLSGVDLYSEFAFVCDGDIFRLGSINDIGSADWFANGSYVRVKVTLSDLKLEGTGDIGASSSATMKNVEFL